MCHVLLFISFLCPFHALVTGFHSLTSPCLLKPMFSSLSLSVSLFLQRCAWTHSMNDRSWTRSYFGWTWTERTVFCLMNVIVNAFILAFVNGAFSQFNFVQNSARFPSSLPGENRLKHTVNRLWYVAEKHPIWLLCIAVCAARFTFAQNET